GTLPNSVRPFRAPAPPSRLPRLLRHGPFGVRRLAAAFTAAAPPPTRHTPIALHPSLCRILPHSPISLPTGGFSMMLDWNDYQKQIGAQLAHFMKLTPDSVRGYQTLSNANSKDSH